MDILQNVGHTMLGDRAAKVSHRVPHVPKFDGVQDRTRCHTDRVCNVVASDSI